MLGMIDRDEYIKEYKKLTDDIIYNEKLPMVTSILDYANKGKADKKLQHVFDFFDDEEEFSNLVKRKTAQFSQEDSDEFIASVISANISDISEAGSIYKKLMATGDTYRICGKDCGSVGREVELPIDEEYFNYNIKNFFITVERGDKDFMAFYSYDEFVQCMKELEVNKIWIRTPMTCKHRYKHGVCKWCAGELPEGVQNIGVFSTLMITEVATQTALSSMNKGVKENPNELLTKRFDIKEPTLKDFYEWAEKILEDLTSDRVERRYFEIALMGRLHYKKDKETGKEEIKVAFLEHPNTDNYFGEFIYRPTKSNMSKILKVREFNDESLKTQIAFNTYKKRKI